MATTARNRLRALLGIALGNEPRLYYSGTTTSNGAADGTTLIDTGIPRYDTSRPVNKWVYITSAGGTNDASGQSRRISSVSSSTVTLVTGFTVRIDTSVTYEILPYDPLDMHNALQYAGRVINADSPLFLAPDETLVVDNLVSNWDFETFSGGAFGSWSSINSPTLTQNTSYFTHGSNSANIAGTAAVRGIEQNLLTAAGGFGRIDQAVGKALHVRGALRATDASNVRLRVTFDGSTYTSGNYHSGDDDWEGHTIHAIDVAIPASLSEMTVSVEKETAVAVQADVVVAWIDPINRYTVPTSFIHPSPLWVSQQVDATKPNGDYAPLTLERPAVPGRILRLEGFGRLTVPTTDSGTVELDETRSELLIALAASFLLQNDPATVQESQVWLARAEALKRSPTIARSQPFTFVNRHVPWKVVDEGGTSYLRLLNR